MREGRPALLGRQILAWGLRRYNPDETRDRNSARSAMTSLRDAVRHQPPPRSRFRRLLQAIESNLSVESADDMSATETLDVVETLLALTSQRNLSFTERVPLHSALMTSF